MARYCGEELPVKPRLLNLDPLSDPQVQIKVEVVAVPIENQLITGV
jgi:hypothetical protein